MSFVKRSTENATLLNSIRKVPERHAALKDGALKDALVAILQAVCMALADALGIRALLDVAATEWTRAQSARDARDGDADQAIRLAFSRLVEWCGMLRDDPLVLAVFPGGVGFVIDAGGNKPEAMALLVDSVRESRDPRLTPERKAEFAEIVGATIEPLVTAQAAARAAWVRRRLARARYDRAADAAWVAAHDAWVTANMRLPASVVADVFAPLVVPAPAASATNGAAAPPTNPDPPPSPPA